MDHYKYHVTWRNSGSRGHVEIPVEVVFTAFLQNGYLHIRSTNVTTYW